VLAVARPDSVIVLSSWHWSLSRSRREALERWVEAGGRLIVDETLVDARDDFERWSGITREYHKRRKRTQVADSDIEDECGTFQEQRIGGQTPASAPAAGYRICNASAYSSLMSRRPLAWALSDESGMQALRVGIGHGSVTAVNAIPYRYLALFDGDHDRLFVAMTQLRRGDEVHFLSEDDHPSLLALTWQHGAPVVALTGALTALLLWRGGVRFGPLAAPPPAARRSLGEQILGTGEFALRVNAESLHAAGVRALDEAAARRVKNYATLAPEERTATLARLSRMNHNALAAAIHDPSLRTAQELPRTIALVEAARRHILTEHGRSRHGAC
jgi:hypothetical protein